MTLRATAKAGFPGGGYVGPPVVRPVTELTVSGRRQSGKTHMLLLYAITQACFGERVLYTTIDQATARNTLYGAKDIVTMLALPVTKIYMSHNRCEIRFPSGGILTFRSAHGQPFSCDTHIMDGVDIYPAQGAARILRTYTNQPWV